MDGSDDRDWKESPLGNSSLLPNEVSRALRSAIHDAIFRETTRRLHAQSNTAQGRSLLADKFVVQLLALRAFDAHMAARSLEAMSLSHNEVVQLFEHCARSLGKDWEADTNDFFDISVAMTRLQMVLRVYCDTISPEPIADSPIHVLVATVPGEQHLFGASLIELSLRLQGWQTLLFSPQDHEDLQRKIVEGNYDVICLSWTTVALSETLFHLHKSVQAIPEPKRPYILAGGLAADKRERWLVRIGVDQICSNVRGAINVISQAIASDRATLQSRSISTRTSGKPRRSVQ